MKENKRTTEISSLYFYRLKDHFSFTLNVISNFNNILGYVYTQIHTDTENFTVAADVSHRVHTHLFLYST